MNNKIKIFINQIDNTFIKQHNKTNYGIIGCISYKKLFLFS